MRCCYWAEVSEAHLDRQSEYGSEWVNEGPTLSFQLIPIHIAASPQWLEEISAHAYSTPFNSFIALAQDPKKKTLSAQDKGLEVSPAVLHERRSALYQGSDPRVPWFRLLNSAN